MILSTVHHTTDGHIHYAVIWQELPERDSRSFDSDKPYEAGDEVNLEERGSSERWYVAEVRPAPEGEPDTLVLARQASPLHAEDRFRQNLFDN
jgi:hypothetical protein